MWEHAYPFSAIVGQDTVRKSIAPEMLLILKSGGVYHCGQKRNSPNLP